MQLLYILSLQMGGMARIVEHHGYEHYEGERLVSDAGDLIMYSCRSCRVKAEVG